MPAWFICICHVSFVFILSSVFVMSFFLCCHQYLSCHFFMLSSVFVMCHLSLSCHQNLSCAICFYLVISICHVLSFQIRMLPLPPSKQNLMTTNLMRCHLKFRWVVNGLRLQLFCVVSRYSTQFVLEIEIVAIGAEKNVSMGRQYVTVEILLVAIDERSWRKYGERGGRNEVVCPCPPLFWQFFKFLSCCSCRPARLSSSVSLPPLFKFTIIA